MMARVGVLCPFVIARGHSVLKSSILTASETQGLPSPLAVKVPTAANHPGYTGPTTKVQRKAKTKTKKAPLKTTVGGNEEKQRENGEQQQQQQQQQQQKAAAQEQRRMIAWASQYGSMVAPGIAPALYGGQQANVVAAAASRQQHGISQVYQRAVANWSQRRDDARSKVKEHASWLHGLGKDLSGFTGGGGGGGGGGAVSGGAAPRTPSAFAKGVEAAEAARDAYKSWHDKYKRRAPEQ